MRWSKVFGVRVVLIALGILALGYSLSDILKQDYSTSIVLVAIASVLLMGLGLFGKMYLRGLKIW